ncbi:hypothetical protein BJX65DRAFT_278804 [Aspergillus insuetus]
MSRSNHAVVWVAARTLKIQQRSLTLWVPMLNTGKRGRDTRNWENSSVSPQLVLAKSPPASFLKSEQSRLDFAVKYTADVGIRSPQNDGSVEPLAFAQGFTKQSYPRPQARPRHRQLC